MKNAKKTNSIPKMNFSAGLAVRFFDFSVTLFLKLGIETRKIAPFNPQFLKISEIASAPVFRVLQNEVKLCNFSARYMLSNMMKDIDRSYWEYGAARKAKKEIARNLLREGYPVEKVVYYTGLPQSTVLELKKEIDSPDT